MAFQWVTLRAISPCRSSILSKLISIKVHPTTPSRPSGKLSCSNKAITTSTRTRTTSPSPATTMVTLSNHSHHLEGAQITSSSNRIRAMLLSSIMLNMDILPSRRHNSIIIQEATHSQANTHSLNRITRTSTPSISCARADMITIHL